MSFLVTAIATFFGCLIGVPITLGIARFFGIYTTVDERRAKVYMLFGKVKGVITDSADDREGFRATAWLLAHYVSLGNRTRREQTTDYLHRYAAGEDPVAAFEASYGITTVAMDAELAEYASRETLTGRTAPRKPYSGSLSTRALAREEALLLLADIAVEVDESRDEGPLCIEYSSRQPVPLSDGRHPVLGAVFKRRPAQ